MPQLLILRALVVAIGFSGLLLGCGPEKKSADLQEKVAADRQKEKIDARADAFQELVGVYRGQWRSLVGEWRNAELVLELVRERRRVGETVISILRPAGRIEVFFDVSQPGFIIGAIRDGDFDPETGELSLMLGPVPGDRGGSDGPTRQFNGTFANGHIEGEMPVNGVATQLIVNRVRRSR